MEINSTTKLIKLSDTTLTPADPAADVRWRHVRDSDGQDLGEVDDLLIDEKEHHVRFLQVASGGFLGLGTTHSLIPVEAITRIEGEHVYIDQSRDHISQAPQYDPELIEDHYYENLYTYYGYPPFWSGSGMYPNSLP